MAYVMVFFHYVVSIAYLLISFSLVILEPYEAIMSLAVSEVAFMNGDADVPQTSIPSQVRVHGTRPDQHWLEGSFPLPLARLAQSSWVRAGTSAVMLKIKALP